MPHWHRELYGCRSAERCAAPGFPLEYVTLGWNVAGIVVLAVGYHPRHSVLGIIGTAVTAAVMLALATGKAGVGRALENPVLRTKCRVTMIGCCRPWTQHPASVGTRLQDDEQARSQGNASQRVLLAPRALRQVLARSSRCPLRPTMTVDPS